MRYFQASQNGSTQAISGDLVVHGAGRVPDIEDMQLERANIDRDKQGIVVNEFLQSPGNSPSMLPAMQFRVRRTVAPCIRL